MKTHLLTLQFIFLFGIAHANPVDSLFTEILPTQEKTYLHLDNNWYFAGDTIWYKAYTVRADNNRPSPLSRILYVELLNEQGFLVERQQLVIDYDGHSHGQFCLSDTAFAGYYELRAYTKWMMNFGYENVRPWWKKWTGKNFHGVSEVDWWPTEQIKHLLSFFPENIYKENSLIIRRPWEKDKHYRELMDLRIAGNPVLLDISPITIESFPEFFGLGVEYKDGDLERLAIDPQIAELEYREYNNLFSRVVPVYQRPDSAHHFRRKLMPVKVTMGDYRIVYRDKDFDAKFYPEGGNLLAGHECRVGWEAVNKYGQRLNASGVLLEDGREIGKVTPLHAGRGDFRFTPRKGSSYKVRFSYDGDTHTFSLPDTKREGYALAVIQDADSVAFRVVRNMEVPRTVYLSLLCRGKVVDVLSLDFEGSEAMVRMPKSAFPAGVNQATLFESAEEVYADRLFFIHPSEGEMTSVEVTGLKGSDYRAKEKVSLGVRLTDGEGKPIAGQRVSVAVRDGSQMDETFCTGNVMTDLLLQSEIRGFVENPDYYFIDRSEKRVNALDLLLMVQGWRRYEWKDVAQAGKFEVTYNPEQTTTVTGQAYDLRLKSRGPKDIFCSLRLLDGTDKDGYVMFQEHVTTDSAGMFGFTIPPFYGKANLVLRGKYKRLLVKQKKYSKLQHDPFIFIRKDIFYPTVVNSLSWYETNKPDLMPSPAISWDDYEKGIYSAVILPEVRIKRKHRPHMKRNRNAAVQRMDFIDFYNDVWDRTYYDPFFQLKNEVFHLDQNLWHVLNHTRQRYSNSLERLFLSFDWDINEVSANMKHFSFLSSVDSIEIITDDPRRPVNYDLKHLDRQTEMKEKGNVPPYGISGYVNIKTRPKEKERIIHGREYNIQGFSRPAEFYNPDYSRQALPDVKDYRKTLYWNPDVKTDSEGRASIDFYNNSVAPDFNISVEGITKDGRFVVY